MKEPVSGWFGDLGTHKDPALACLLSFWRRQFSVVVCRRLRCYKSKNSNPTLQPTTTTTTAFPQNPSPQAPLPWSPTNLALPRSVDEFIIPCLNPRLAFFAFCNKYSTSETESRSDPHFPSFNSPHHTITPRTNTFDKMDLLNSILVLGFSSNL